MSERPYMKFYVADYTSDTQTLTLEQHGAYMLLLMAMWRAGGWLPNDPQKLARILRVSTRKWALLAPELMPFFVANGHQITQKRVQIELEKAREISHARSRARKGKPLADNELPFTIDTTNVGTIDDIRARVPLSLSESKEEESKSGRAAPSLVQEAFQRYNVAAEQHGLPKAVAFTATRKKKLSARLKEHGVEGWDKALAEIALSSFLRGDNDRKWKADIDFLLTDKLARVIEGRYRDEARTGAHRNGAGWVLPQGTPEYDAWASHYRRTNNPEQWGFTDEKGHVARAPDRWPPSR